VVRFADVLLGHHFLLCNALKNRLLALMLVNGKSTRTIWAHPTDSSVVQVIDQRRLPHHFEVLDLRTVDDGVVAIRDMAVRGAPLIGATAAWSMFLAVQQGMDLEQASAALLASRPTAVNLRWAVDRMNQMLAAATKTGAAPDEVLALARAEAALICEEDIEISKGMGRHGLPFIEAAHRAHPDRPVNILTHCNAGWLAAVDWGTATAPIYTAHEAGIPVHVWVDETRPRNQGARLTAWELGQHGVPHTVIVDNAGGHLMQRGRVDVCIVGTDRTTRTGDVANKIGTYLKALAAQDNGIPFYVALPSTTIDWTLRDGMEIPIEERSPEEVTHLYGVATGNGAESGIKSGDKNAAAGYFQVTPTGSGAANPAFDVTPAKYVTALITERGSCDASEAGLLSLFPEEA